jgi:hypothetical protein
VFDLYGNQRVAEWKRVRSELEFSDTPFEDVAELWSRAPFVNPYLNYLDPKSWPDPWQLVIDCKLDDLAIVLGMLYTLKLTQRFMDTRFEIHMSIINEEKQFFLLVDNCVLNFEPKVVHSAEVLKEVNANKIWEGVDLP